jgi:hypothetical protein
MTPGSSTTDSQTSTASSSPNDISNGQPTRFLRTIADVAKVPVYFVLGNHDFYNSTSRPTIRSLDNRICDR